VSTLLAQETSENFLDDSDPAGRWVLLPRVEQGNEYVFIETRIAGDIRILAVPQSIPPWWERYADQMWQLLLAILGGGAMARYRDLWDTLRTIGKTPK